MPFIEDILRYKNLSLVGMEKNTGKTEVLNYILGRLPSDVRTCVTSIGIDGETTDQVTETRKPEIFLRNGMLFSTSEKHYPLRKIVSKIIDISSESTSLGRIITAEALSCGTVLLSGPASTSSLKRWIGEMEQTGCDLTIVDGALSRMSSASAAICDAMILSTGTALSINIETLVRKTAFQVEMIRLPLAGRDDIELFEKYDTGICIIDKESGKVIELESLSALAMKESEKAVLQQSEKIYLSGALTDKFLNAITGAERKINKEVIIKDFTKIFISAATYGSFLRKGGKISVLNRTKLIAICINPIAPSGYRVDSEELKRRIEEATGVKTFDIWGGRKFVKK